MTPAGARRGREAIHEYWCRQRNAFPDLHLALDLVVAQGDVVMSEWTWVGTNTGPLTLRDGTRARATGRPIELRGMEVVRIRNGQIVEYRMYWDGLDLAQQLASARRWRAPDHPPAEVRTSGDCAVTVGGAGRDKEFRVGEAAGTTMG